MKSILLIFEDSEFEKMKRRKKLLNSKTWKKMIMELIK